MTKARLIQFSAPKKNTRRSELAKRKKLYAQISNSKSTVSNNYSKPDRFARARFLSEREIPYRSRAAFKLLEIEEKHRICAKKKRILDLGAAPGSWLQVASDIAPNAQLLGIDQKIIEPFTEQTAAQRIQLLQEGLHEPQKFPAIAQRVIKILGGKPDCILSDIAPNTCGQAQIDNDRLALLVENLLPLVYAVLQERGDFIAKLRHAAGEKKMLDKLKKRFQKIQLLKPQASRKSANEIYLLAKGFSLPQQ